MTDLEAKVEEIYSRLPGLDCQQKCQKSCGPILMSEVEWGRILKRVGDRAKVLNDDLTCPMLDKGTGLCQVYEIRPLVCRLYGMIERMRCPYGCKPLFPVSEQQARGMLKELLELKGS